MLKMSLWTGDNGVFAVSLHALGGQNSNNDNSVTSINSTMALYMRSNRVYSKSEIRAS